MYVCTQSHALHTSPYIHSDNLDGEEDTIRRTLENLSGGQVSGFTNCPFARAHLSLVQRIAFFLLARERVNSWFGSTGCFIFILRGQHFLTLRKGSLLPVLWVTACRRCRWRLRRTDSMLFLGPLPPPCC